MLTHSSNRFANGVRVLVGFLGRHGIVRDVAPSGYNKHYVLVEFPGGGSDWFISDLLSPDPLPEPGWMQDLALKDSHARAAIAARTLRIGAFRPCVIEGGRT